MRRFFVEEIRAHEGRCAITGSEAKHISRVLRMGPGDRLILMDATGARFLARIESASAREVRVALEQGLQAPSPSPVRIVLYQSLLKSPAMDDLIQKTSQLGVDAIFPFYSQRTVVRLDPDRRSARAGHWRKISQSAAKQSGRTRPPEIGDLCSLDHLTVKDRDRDAFRVILWEEEGQTDLKGLLRASAPAGTFTGIVGPEGGFTPDEIQRARDAGFIPVSLGHRILRAETAATALVAIVQYEWGDLGAT